MAGERALRWEGLFADLEAQAHAMAIAEDEAEIAERTRIEIGKLRLVDRLRPALGHEVQMDCLGAGPLTGRLDRVGSDWVLLTERARRATIVSLAAVLTISGLGALSALPGSEGRVGSRLDLRHALRGLVRDRSPVQLLLVRGSPIIGTLDRVGADYVEVAEHPADQPRRATSVRRVRAVSVTALAAVRSGE